jgi:hypothetical protein
MEMNNLIIKIYVNINDKQELEQLVEKLNLKNKKYFEIDIEKNNDFSEEKSKEFPDGFMYFPFIISYYNNSNLYTDEDVNNSKIIIEKLWKNNIPAIAASDYEDKLPENGGYKSKNVPWKTQK